MGKESYWEQSPSIQTFEWKGRDEGNGGRQAVRVKAEEHVSVKSNEYQKVWQLWKTATGNNRFCRTKK